MPGKYAPPDRSPVPALRRVRRRRARRRCVAFRALQIRRDERVRRTEAAVGAPGIPRPRHLGHALTAPRSTRHAPIGYRTIKLDTLPAIMPNAVAMYRAFGFVECEPYYHNPIPGSLYMELAL